MHHFTRHSGYFRVLKPSKNHVWPRLSLELWYFVVDFRKWWCRYSPSPALPGLTVRFVTKITWPSSRKNSLCILINLNYHDLQQSQPTLHFLFTLTHTSCLHGKSFDKHFTWTEKKVWNGAKKLFETEFSFISNMFLTKQTTSNHHVTIRRRFIYVHELIFSDISHLHSFFSLKYWHQYYWRSGLNRIWRERLLVMEDIVDVGGVGERRSHVTEPLLIFLIKAQLNQQGYCSHLVWRNMLQGHRIHLSW